MTERNAKPREDRKFHLNSCGSYISPTGSQESSKGVGSLATRALYGWSSSRVIDYRRGHWRRFLSLLRCFTHDILDIFPLRDVVVDASRLESEEQQEGHHETEEPHSLRQGEPENGVGEELLFQTGVARIADDQTAEHTANTGTCQWEKTN